MSQRKGSRRIAEESRSVGTLVGLAVGNILGLKYEGWQGAEVRRVCPGGHLPVPLQELARPWDDDLAMAMELSEHLLESQNDIDSTVLLQRYTRWMTENGRGIGGLTREVLTLAQAGSLASPAERVWRARGGSAGTGTAGNGAVMRIAPVGIRYRRHLPDLVRNALVDARLTHWDPLCQWTSASTAVLISDLIMGRVTPLEEFLPEHGCPETALKSILEEPLIDIESSHFDGPSMGYTLHAWKVALWASHAPGTFRDLLQRIIRCGGDTDTNGAVAGAVLGARFGRESVPQEWTEPVRGLAHIQATALKLHSMGLPGNSRAPAQSDPPDQH